MQISCRNALASDGVGARSYVQNGLVAMWDGIENAGWGQHDPNATVWKGLVPNSFDLQPSGDVSLISNAYQFGTNGGIGRMSNGNVSRSIRTATACAYLRQSANTWMLTLSCDSNNNRGKVLAFWNNRYVGTGWSSTPKFQTAGSIMGASTWTVLYNDSRWATSAYRNASSLTQEGTEGFGASSDLYRGVVVGDRLGNSSWRLVGEVYNIRLYSRALTADEIAYNYSIDKERFGLP